MCAVFTYAVATLPYARLTVSCFMYSSKLDFSHQGQF